jgi:hypothetical protein
MRIYLSGMPRSRHWVAEFGFGEIKPAVVPFEALNQPSGGKAS